MHAPTFIELCSVKFETYISLLINRFLCWRWHVQSHKYTLPLSDANHFCEFHQVNTENNHVRTLEALKASQLKNLQWIFESHSWLKCRLLHNCGFWSWKEKLEKYLELMQFCHSPVSAVCSHSESPNHFAYVVQDCRLVNKTQHKVKIKF